MLIIVASMMGFVLPRTARRLRLDGAHDGHFRAIGPAIGAFYNEPSPPMPRGIKFFIALSRFLFHLMDNGINDRGRVGGGLRGLSPRGAAVRTHMSTRAVRPGKQSYVLRLQSITR